MRKGDEEREKERIEMQGVLGGEEKGERRENLRGKPKEEREEKTIGERKGKRERKREKQIQLREIIRVFKYSNY